MTRVLDHVDMWLYRRCAKTPTFHHESGGAPAAGDLAAQHQHLMTAGLRGARRVPPVREIRDQPEICTRAAMRGSVIALGTTRALSVLLAQF